MPRARDLGIVIGSLPTGPTNSVLDIAGVGFHQLPIAFADVAPFRKFGLTKEPALMLGMDALRLFRHVDVDFANREVRFSLPRDTVRDHF